MARRAVDEVELVGVAAAAVTVALAKAYERRIRRLQRQLDRAHARLAVRAAEQVLLDAVAARLHADPDDSK